MSKKRIMIVGATDSGKTTLANKLNNNKDQFKRTQDIIYSENTIYIPGSYIESPWMHKHIITISQDASHALFLVDQSRCINVYPPGFAKAFRCPVIGIISKSDLIIENEQSCIKHLKDTMVLPPFYRISKYDDTSIERLKEKLFSEKA